MRLMPEKDRAVWLKLIPELLRLVAWSALLCCSIVLSLTALYLVTRSCWWVVVNSNNLF